MEAVKVTAKGQIIIPQEIREKMSLKKRDKIIFFEENGKFFQNSNVAVLSTFQKNMEGAARETGFKDPDDVTEYIKQLRKNSCVFAASVSWCSIDRRPRAASALTARASFCSALRFHSSRRPMNISASVSSAS
jgi:AbrB family looped-hinge helix DNA binding protein